MSITEEAPPAAPTAQRRPWLWWWLVAASAVILLTVVLVLAVWWAVSRETRTTSYRVLGELAGIQLDLGEANVEITGGAPAVEVRRIDRFSFGRPSIERRDVDRGTLRIVSRCRPQVLGSCDADYRITVPDNVPLEIESTSGAISLTGVRATVTLSTGSGAIDVARFCGFSLGASTDSGAIRAGADCSADRLELRSRTGDIDVTVPPGRYRVDAQSDAGTSRVRGLATVDDAPYEIDARSTEGDVDIEAEQ